MSRYDEVYLPSRIIKYSVVADGIKIHFSLEPEFANLLKDIAQSRGISWKKLIDEINHDRSGCNLSSSLRLYALKYIKGEKPMAFNIIGMAMTLLKHRDSIAKIVAVLPELKTIFSELNPEQPQQPPPAPVSGHEVGSMAWLQDSLNTLGADPQLDVDGEYGPATNKAVSAYQKEHGLVVDGWAGASTVSSILEELDKRGATG